MKAAKIHMSFVIGACLFCFCSFLSYILNGREQEYFMGCFDAMAYTGYNHYRPR